MGCPLHLNELVYYMDNDPLELGALIVFVLKNLGMLHWNASQTCVQTLVVKIVISFYILLYCP